MHVNIRHFQSFDKHIFVNLRVVIDPNLFSPAHNNSIVTLLSIGYHESDFCLWNGHQSNIFIANEGSCTIKSDVSIDEMTYCIYVIDDGDRATC